MAYIKALVFVGIPKNESSLISNVNIHDIPNPIIK